MKKINLVANPYGDPINSQKELKAKLEAGADFIIADVSNTWNGMYVSLPELKKDKYTHAQIRYGKNNTKVWYGPL